MTAPNRAPLLQKLRALDIERWRWVLTPVLIFLITRIGLWAVAALGNTLLPSNPPQIYAPLRPENFWLGLFAKYDSEWYILIASYGYTYSAEQFSSAAFFPLYPILIRGLAFFLGKNLYLAGLVISNGCFLLGLTLFYHLAQEFFPQDKSLPARAALFLCLMPSSVFFTAIYTESLFFFLIIGCVFFARKRQWLVSALFGAAASATRSLGVLVMLWAGWEWLAATGWNWRKPLALPAWGAARREWRGAALLLIPAGLVAFMLYLWRAFGDPLAFLHAQAGWDQALVGPLQVLINYFSRLAREPGYEYAPVFNYSLALLGTLCTLLPRITRRWGFGALIFCALSVLIPFSASLLSLHRFILPLFPLPLALAEVSRNRWVNLFILAGFALLTGIFSVAFTNWGLFF